jgi:hypothetical protein
MSWVLMPFTMSVMVGVSIGCCAVGAHGVKAVGEEDGATC